MNFKLKHWLIPLVLAGPLLSLSPFGYATYCKYIKDCKRVPACIKNVTKEMNKYPRMNDIEPAYKCNMIKLFDPIGACYAGVSMRYIMDIKPC